MVDTSNQAATANQSQYSDDQSFKVDIEAFYNGFIKQIDAIRSNVSIVDNSAQISQFIKSLNSTNPPTFTIIAQLKIDPNNPHEPRCHAFYRLLGLPSFEPGGSFYSPGLIHGSVANIGANTINLNETKINVAKNLTSIYPLMDQREKNVNQFLQIFSVSNIDASVLALSSTKIRKFSVLPTQTINPFDTNVADQSYPITDGTQNLTHTADFLGSDGYAYQDSNGNMPSTKVQGFLATRAHIIKPFMVDPRVELTINPPYVGSPGTSDNTVACKIVGAPFPTDKSQHQYVENVYASSPVIEAVCRARLVTGQPTSNLSTRLQAVTNYVTNTDATKDADLLAMVTQVTQNSSVDQTDQVFLKYINIMRSMMDVLFDALHVIYDTEDAKASGIPLPRYHWVPIPNVKGPEFGSTTQGIIIGDPLNTEGDLAIVSKIVQSEISQITSQNTQNNKPDLGNFVNFETIPLSPDNQSTDSFGNTNEETLDDMVNKRNAQTDKANDALRHIEIIMGEFSGLGLCDIIAIYLALWTITPADLVNMLDNGAFNRLAQDPTLQSEAVQARMANNGQVTNPITTTMTNFEQQVINNYAIMDKLWDDRNQNQGTSNIG